MDDLSQVGMSVNGFFFFNLGESDWLEIFSGGDSILEVSLWWIKEGNGVERSKHLECS